MIHVPDISKDFILNKAVRDATNILLRPYMPVILSESSSSIYGNKYETTNSATHKWILNSQDFLLRMTRIAWDFLNVFSVLRNNVTNETIEENATDNDI